MAGASSGEVRRGVVGVHRCLSVFFVRFQRARARATWERRGLVEDTHGDVPRVKIELKFPNATRVFLLCFLFNI